MKKYLQGTVGTAGVIALITVFSRIFGLLRKLAQSWAVSDGAVANAYDSANTVPNVLFEIAAGGALAGAVIPLISGFLARNLRQEVDRTASALINWVLLVGMPIAVLVNLFSLQIVTLLFGVDADPNIVSLASVLLKIFAIQIPLYGLSVVFTGILQAHKKFILAALAPLFSSLVVIATFLFYATKVGYAKLPQELSDGNILLLGVGTTLGVVIFSLPQAIPVLRLINFHFTLHFPPEVGKRALHLATGGLGALIAQQIAILVIMFTANSLGDVGTYNAFTYAFAIFMVPYGVLAVPVATTVFPRISEAVAIGSRKELITVVENSTTLVAVMGVISSSLLISLARPAKTILDLGRDITGLEYALWAMALALFGYSLLYHGARILYAFHATRRVIVVNSIAWGTVCGSLLLAFIFSVEGRIPTLVSIGIAMSVGLSLGAILVLLGIRKELKEPIFIDLSRTVILFILIYVPFTALAIWFVDLLFNVVTNEYVAVLLCVLIVGLSALGLGFALLERWNPKLLDRNKNNL